VNFSARIEPTFVPWLVTEGVRDADIVAMLMLAGRVLSW
jgi:hypothetical protein